MSQNNLFSRRLAEALREAATSPVTVGAVVGNAVTVNERLRAAIVASVDTKPEVSVHIHRPAVCYRCADNTKEAFPYGVTTIFGDEYTFLCNDCWWWLMNASLIASVEDEVWPDEEE